MPRLCDVDPWFECTVTDQDWVVHRDQALAAGLTRRAIDHRLGLGRWQVLLPGVYLCHPGEPSRRQRLIAALRFAGPDSAIDGIDACFFHGVRAVRPSDRMVHVVVPFGAQARSRGFVSVRRTVAEIRSVESTYLRYLEPAPAVIAAARRMTDDRRIVALLSDALQRRIVTHEQLLRAHVAATPRNACRTDRAIARLGTGAQSLPEVDFLDLVAASPILPAPVCNALLRLPGNTLISPDALFAEARLVHETNGRIAHARADLFEDMQERHGIMTAAGLTVLHSSPAQQRERGRVVIAQVERCFLRDRGRGLPPGVELVRIAV